MLGLRLQDHQIHHVDDADADIRDIAAQEGYGSKGLEGRHIPRAGHDHVGITGIVAGPLPNASADGAVANGRINVEPLPLRLFAGDITSRQLHHGNDAAAAKFKAETGIATYKWDVSNYKECAEGLKKVEADLGPIDILVNNAGITRDAAFHKMTPEQWYEVINTNLNSLFNMTRPVIEGMRNRGFGRIVNISSINGPERPVRPGELLRRESGRHRLSPRPFASATAKAFAIN
jgi:NAD(P)-dependent dehydrogenase (short-subunit alcohol dehydrogenase family)